MPENRVLAALGFNALEQVRMIHMVDTLNRVAQCRDIKEIPVDLLNRKFVEPDGVAGAPEEAADGVAVLKEEFHQMAADESGGSRNECFNKTMGVIED